jgi:myo-inositol-1(or 4)-monophosphatase
LQEAALLHRLAVATTLAHQAGVVMKQRTGGPNLRIETKSASCDLVTEVDRACDVLISEGLRQAFAQDTLITEETWQEGESLAMDQAWVVDPIDGTTNFAHGFPHFAVSIAYVVAGQPVVGVIHDPMKGETFTSIAGQGVQLNGQPLTTTAITDLDKALLATGFPYDHGIKPMDNMAYFLAFMAACHGVRRTGSAALDLAYVAAGRLDGLWKLRLAPWDIAAGMLMVQEAGGLITGFDQQAVVLAQRKIDLLVSNGQPTLHTALASVCQTVAQQLASVASSPSGVTNASAISS